jgi:long-chain acyl-CoA synthetase
MAKAIKKKVEGFSFVQRLFFNVFNALNINTLSNRNPLKKVFLNTLLKSVRKIYGGRADYFIVGSAPADVETLKIFYSVGTKIYQGYGQSETEIIAINDDRNFRIGSVGKPQTKVKISDDGEILIQYKKEHEKNKDILNVDGEGFVHTGDLGYFDKDGFLFLIGRKDDVVVLRNGKKLFPLDIEGKFRKMEGIGFSLVFSPDGLIISLILSPQKQHVFADHNLSELKKSIVEANKMLESHQRVSSFFVCAEPFTAENGMLTHTFKMRRQTIISTYRNEKFESIV